MNLKIDLTSIAIGILIFTLGLISAYLVNKYTKPKQTSTDRLVAMADGFLISRGLYVIAELKIADQLIAGPKTAAQIAHNLNLNGEALFRLLRMLAAHGVFKFVSDTTFALNEISELLTSNNPNSLRGFLLHEDPARWQAYGALDYTIKTGKPAFNHLFGEGYFDYIARDKIRSEQFDEGMANLSESENLAIASKLDFSRYTHIIDIGGGVGGLITSILNQYPLCRATLYELPHLVPLAKNYLQQNSLVNRTKIVAGSFLDTVIPGGDLYILKRIMHDWNDETCLKILKNCHRAMQYNNQLNNSQLMIFDCIVPAGKDYDISKDIDVIMMTIFGGKERTKQDFEIILNQAGFTILEVTTVPGTMLSCIKAKIYKRPGQ